jgi:hypothetical protein
MKNIIYTLLFLMTPAAGLAQVNLDYYLPDNVSYNPDIPTPEEVIGHQVGEWHITHDKLVQYMYALADASDRVTIEEYARSYEDRPLLLLTITSPANHANIESIKQNQQALTDPNASSDLDIENMPVIVTLGHSVHGNEPSGANASMLAAYHFAAATGNEMDAMLDNSVILLDPSFNPDGLNRFASWVNIHKSATTVTDPNSREFDEVWPGGRTNHYWFDLNRDWMPVQHPESRGRIAKFHEWRPNIITDQHEMGTNSTYFFQPGIPSRTNPLTPQINQDLTAAIAEYHAKALDDIQSLYYTRESFDDFYYGKGSSYPDVFGTVGILFEQGSSRGHAQESVNGVVEFPFTIRNQFYTSLSTMEAAVALRTDLHEYRRSYYADMQEEASESDIKAYVVGDMYDSGRNYHLADLLTHHNVDVYELAEDIEANGRQFESGKAWVIPAGQTEHRFIKAMFERRTEFTDSLFYDVSTWTLPYAFNLPFAELGSRQFSSDLMGALVENPQLPEAEVIGGQSNYAYAFEWDEYYAPRTLYRLQKMGVRTKVAARSFTTQTANGSKMFNHGTIVVPLGIQEVSDEDIYETLNTAAAEDGVPVYALSTGLSAGGIDLGSPNMETLTMPSIALISGEGTSSYEVGEMWHLLDQRYQIPATLLDKNRLSRADLSRYTDIVMASGYYGDLSENVVDELKRWVRNGGTLILQRGAIEWGKSEGLVEAEEVEREDVEYDESLTYLDISNARGAQFIGGTIFHANLDTTNPLGYGYRRGDLQVFRSGTRFLQMPDNHFAAPVSLTDTPLASGYISEENLEAIPNTVSALVSSSGSGRIISFVDNPNFRAFWFGTNKLFANALFFGDTISGAATE